MTHLHLDATREHDLDTELRRGVVLIVEFGMTVSVRNGVNHFDGDDVGRTLSVAQLIEPPLSDVDMMGAPVGHFAAGVFVPPTEFIVAT